MGLLDGVMNVFKLKDDDDYDDEYDYDEYDDEYNDDEDKASARMKLFSGTKKASSEEDALKKFNKKSKNFVNGVRKIKGHPYIDYLDDDASYDEIDDLTEDTQLKFDAHVEYRDYLPDFNYKNESLNEATDNQYLYRQDCIL